MANNRKPKLAPESRWEGDTVVDEDGREMGCYNTQLSDTSKSHAFYIKSVHSVFATDAIAVIRAAKLDPVWDAAVRLLNVVEFKHEHQDQRTMDIERCIRRIILAVELASESTDDTNSAAVRGATNDE